MMRINVSFDEDVYPELKEKLGDVRTNKRGALLVKMADQMLCLERMNSLTINSEIISEIITEDKTKEDESSISIAGYDMDEQLVSLFDNLGVAS
jgi:hypothetical protein